MYRPSPDTKLEIIETKVAEPAPFVPVFGLNNGGYWIRYHTRRSTAHTSGLAWYGGWDLTKPSYCLPSIPAPSHWFQAPSVESLADAEDERAAEEDAKPKVAHFQPGCDSFTDASGRTTWSANLTIIEMDERRPEVDMPFLGLSPAGRWKVYLAVIVGCPQIYTIYFGHNEIAKNEWPTHWTYVPNVRTAPPPDPDWAHKLRAHLSVVYSHGINTSLKTAINSCVTATVREMRDGR